MRLLFEHTRTYSVAHSIFVCTKVDLSSFSTVANKRDIYLRVFQDPAQSGHTGTHIYAFRTLDDALNFPGTSGFPYTATTRTTWKVVAYAEDQTLSGSSQVVALTNNSGYAPDVSGLAVTINGAGDATAWNAVYGYTDSPAAVVLNEIEYLLTQRMSAGQILDGFQTAAVVKGPEDYIVLSTAPDIVAAIGEEADALHENADRFALTVRFGIVVGNRGLDQERNYTDVLRYAGSIRSLLMDEEWDLNLGVTDPAAHSEVIIGTVEGPMPIEGEEEPYLAARLVGQVVFPLLHSDRSA